MRLLHRRQMRLFGWLISGSAVVLALSAAASPSSPRASMTSFPGNLNGVSAVSADDAWAVGSSGSGTLILHWDGTAWRRVTSPSPGSGAALSAVSALAPSDAWAVGSDCAAHCGTVSPVVHALILHWNGTAWRTVASPSPRGAVYAMLQGVSAQSPSSAWAAGFYCKTAACSLFGGGVLHSLILRWNGTAWTRVASPNPGGTHGTLLTAVSSSSPANAWAVGTYGTKQTVPVQATKSLVLHWNGTAWAQMPSPSRGVPPGSMLSSVSALSPSDAWAVGSSFFYVPDEQFSLALRWNGSTWAQVKSPNPGSNGIGIFAPFNGVSALSPSNAWAVGSFQPSAGLETFVAHWNGTSWTKVPSPNPGTSSGVSDSLNAVSAQSPENAWAVGEANGTTLILHWNGTRWTQS